MSTIPSRFDSHSQSMESLINAELARAQVEMANKIAMMNRVAMANQAAMQNQATMAAMMNPINSKYFNL